MTLSSSSSNVKEVFFSVTSDDSLLSHYHDEHSNSRAVVDQVRQGAPSEPLIDTNALSQAQHEEASETSVQYQQLRKVKLWKRRIQADSDLIWNKGEIKKYFEKSVIQRLLSSFMKSTFNWIHAEISPSKVEPLTETKLEHIYLAYLVQFQKLADALIQKKKEEMLKNDIQKYEHLFRAGQNEKSPSSFTDALANMTSNHRNGLDLAFHFVRQRPDMML